MAAVAKSSVSDSDSEVLQEQPLLRRLILVIILLQALGFALLVWNSMRLYEDNNIEARQHYANDQSILLSAALAPSLQAADQQQILTTLSLMADNEQLHFAGVYSTDRRLLASLGTPPMILQDTAQTDHKYTGLVDGIWVIEQPITANAQIIGIVQLGFIISGQGLSNRAIGLQNTIIALLGLLLVIISSVVMLLPLERDLNHLLAGIQILRNGDWQHRVATSRALAPLARMLNSLATETYSQRLELMQQHDRYFRETQALRALLQSSNAVFWEAEPNHRGFSHISDDAERLLGFSATQWLQPDFIERYVHPNDYEWLEDFLAHPGSSNDGLSMELRVRDNTDQWRWLHLLSSIENRAQGPVLVGLLIDISEQKRNEAQAAYLSHHDSLTGLNNHNRFQQRLQDQIAVNQRSGNSGALLCLAVDDYNSLHIVFGQEVADQCLRQLAHTLQKTFSSLDIGASLGRLDSTTFGILLPTADADQAINMAAKLLTWVRNEMVLHAGQRIVLSANIGIVLFPEHGDEALTLLANSNLALLQAGKSGSNNYCLFANDTTMVNLQEQWTWKEILLCALEEQRFRLYFQPVVNLQNGVIRYYESRVNLIDENDQLINQEKFSDLAEQMGLSEQLEQWCCEQSVQAQKQRLDITGPLPVTLTLSQRFCLHPDAVQRMQGILIRSGATRGGIIAKLPAAAVIQAPDACQHLITAMQKLKNRCIVHQVGKDLSQLDILREVKVDFLELSSTFVQRLSSGDIERAALLRINKISRACEARLIAAGIDNNKLLTILLEADIGLGYGNILAKQNSRFHSHNRVVIADRSEES